MTDWVQHHPTETLKTPDGQTVEIDTEIAPLVAELWRLGYATKLACQDAGEAILNGGTRVAPQDREELSERHRGRAWIIVRIGEGPRLLDAVMPLPSAGEWKLIPVRKDRDADSWITVTFPREDIAPATALLQGLPGESQRPPERPGVSPS